MASRFDRRGFLRIVGASLAPSTASRRRWVRAHRRGAFACQLSLQNGKSVTPFFFLHLSDTHLSVED